MACATAEAPTFSAGECVAGGCQHTGTTTTTTAATTACNPDPGCTVHWATDIFTGILDGPAGCTSSACHGSGKGGITLVSGQSTDAYNALLGYTLLSVPGPAKKYIVPCDPAASGFPCNMVLAADGGADPYPPCGFSMPFGAGAAALTLDQLTKIGTWITCGAPDN
jgi:hypothetical protein